jgi:hypothetical protein
MRDTIDIIREAGFVYWEQFPTDYQNKLKAFEALVRADEREACAKVCDDMNDSDWFPRQCAAAIRARGETK